MLKQKYFLTGIFILSAERQPIKLAWRKIVWLRSYILKKMNLNELDQYSEIIIGLLNKSAVKINNSSLNFKLTFNELLYTGTAK